MSLSQNYPTDGGNLGFALANDGTAASTGFGIPSWYMLNSRVQTGTNAWPGGNKVSPFMWFNSSATAADLQDSKYRRVQGQVKKASELVMIVEATNPNWYDQAETSPGIFLGRLAGRHGRPTRDGKNAFTNFAFFDGHVGTYATELFTKKSPNSGGTPDNSLIDYYKETIFFLNKQKK